MTQLNLFGGGEMAVDTTFATAHRIRLDATSWVEHVPGWLSGSDQLLQELIETAEWEQRTRWIVDRRMTEPRLTAEYQNLTTAPQLMLHTTAEVLSEHYGIPYDGLWINYYRDHHDSTGWHGDRGRLPECIVPVLSLGATRRFLLKPREGGRSIVIAPAGGDLIVMGGRCQRDWRHGVPKQTTPTGARISVNYSSRAQAATTAS
jgi:alkylated DNA repair dioxygenase AlkB